MMSFEARCLSMVCLLNERRFALNGDYGTNSKIPRY
jgi:hypothetical protein